MVKLLGDWLDTPPIAELCDHLEGHILSLDAGEHPSDPMEDDRRVRRFLSQGAGLYRMLLELGHRQLNNRIAPELLGQIKVLANRAHRPRTGGGTWVLMRDESDSLIGWRDLLSHPDLVSLPGASDVASQFDLPREEQPQEPVKAASPDKVNADLEELLREHDLYYPRELRVHVGGVPRDYLRLFRAALRLDGSPEEEVNVKVYKLPPPGEYAGIRELLLTMWEKERRLLDDLSSRPHGRGLTTFRGSYIDSNRGYLLVVTEGVNDRTLRDLLIQGEFGAGALAERGKIWKKLFWIIEAVDTLHQHGYLHREIRPENVLQSRNDDLSPLKLANFEWSVYLQALAEKQTKAWRAHDYYFAPEILKQRHAGVTGDAAAGESFASDVYALGLLLFEVLVRRLDTELDLYSHGGSYDYDAHCRWIAKLRKEAATRLDSFDERLLIERMLVAEPEGRETNLTWAVEAAWQLVRGTSDLQKLLHDGQPPVLVSLLRRNTPDSIDRYLSDEGVDLSRVGPRQDDLAHFVEGELAGARVYRNGGDPNWPLLLEGRRVSFVAQPFEHEGNVFRSLPFLNVARLRDWKSGHELVRLPGKTEMLDLAQARNQVSGREMGNLIRQGLIWERLFLDAAKVDDDLRPNSVNFTACSPLQPRLSAASGIVMLSPIVWSIRDALMTVMIGC